MANLDMLFENARRCVVAALVAASACRPAPSSPPPETPTAVSTPTITRGEGWPRLPAGTVARVDGDPIREGEVEQLRKHAEALHAGRELRPPTRAELLDALIYHRLLALEGSRSLSPEEIELAAEDFRLSGDPQQGLVRNRWTEVNDKWTEIALLRRQGMLDISEAEVQREFERTKGKFVSDVPWIRGHVVRLSWDRRTGVPDCDVSFYAERRCLDLHMDLRFRAQRREALDAVADLWRNATSADASANAAACRESIAFARSPHEALGCDSPKVVTKAELAAEKKRVRRDAQELRARASEQGGTLIEAAIELGWKRRSDRDAPPEPSPSSPPRIAKLVQTIPLGDLSTVVDDGGSFWLVQVSERWPAGTLPLEARRRQIVRKLQNKALPAARDAFRARVLRSHEIVREDDPVP